MLKTMLATGAAVCLPACVTNIRFDGSFLQLWRDHLSLPKETWSKLFDLMQQAGCRELFLQWVAMEDGEDSWQASDEFLRTLFDLAQERNMGMHLGLPYRADWWEMLDANDMQRMETFLAQTQNDARRYVAASSLAGHPQFRGWYIPYELEQYHWATATSQEKLIPWLQVLSAIATTTQGQAPSISTYFSRIPTEGSLVSLWKNILDHTALYPMVQDGAGVAGLDNYMALAPLRDLFNTRQIDYDLIVELFHQTSDDSKQEPFQAISASPSRVRQQIARARDFDATRIIVFAIDPWLTDKTQEAQLLRNALFEFP